MTTHTETHTPRSPACTREAHASCAGWMMERSLTGSHYVDTICLCACHKDSRAAIADCKQVAS